MKIGENRNEKLEDEVWRAITVVPFWSLRPSHPSLYLPLNIYWHPPDHHNDDDHVHEGDGGWLVYPCNNIFEDDFHTDEDSFGDYKEMVRRFEGSLNIPLNIYWHPSGDGHYHDNGVGDNDGDTGEDEDKGDTFKRDLTRPF